MPFLFIYDFKDNIILIGNVEIWIWGGRREEQKTFFC